jgi:hypothetical protein
MAASMSIAAVGCSLATGPADDRERETIESCQADVRNDEWNVDCSVACNHVMSCQATTGDSDLATLTCGDCLGSCVAGVALGGNDLVEGTEEDRRSWECAELVEGCSALDHNCDIF